LKQKLLLIISIITFQVGMSQSVEISGIVESNTSLENINIINKTTYSYAITNANGEFKITVQQNDTLQFSSMLHKTKYVVIDKNNLLLKAIKVNLEDQINQLREVTVGNRLTGDLHKDINNVEGNPPINFYDVGIAGYTGKVATQSERVMNEATTGPGGEKLKWYSPLTGSIPLNPIINGISGRTKMLKERVKIEENEALIQSIKGKLSKDFFASNPLEEDLRMDFFYFCADDERFIKYCKNETDFKIMTFLRMKYKEYLENLKEGKN
jgi:CarboxypepD_reg-like domain